MAKRSVAASSAEKDGVVWNKRQRGRVFGSPRPLPIDVPPPDREAAWSSVCELYGKPELYRLPKEADRKLEPVLDELRREMLGGTAPADTTLEREQLRAHVLLYEGTLSDKQTKWDRVASALVPFWAGIGGLPFAARVVWTPPLHEASSTSCGDARRAFGVGASTSQGTLGTSSELWWLNLRRQALAAPAKDYDDAAWACQDLLAGAVAFAARMAVALAATFCRCPDEAHRLAQAHLEQVGRDNLPLLSAIADPSLALEFARAHSSFASGATNHAFNLVDNLGKGAAPTLLDLLESVKDTNEARKALAAAAVLSDPDLCHTTVTRLKGPAKTTLGAALAG